MGQVTKVWMNGADVGQRMSRAVFGFAADLGGLYLLWVSYGPHVLKDCLGRHLRQSARKHETNDHSTVDIPRLNRRRAVTQGPSSLCDHHYMRSKSRSAHPHLLPRDDKLGINIQEQINVHSVQDPGNTCRDYFSKRILIQTLRAAASLSDQSRPFAQKPTSALRILPLPSKQPVH